MINSFDTSMDGLENINMFGNHPSLSENPNLGLYVDQEPIIIDTPLKKEVSDKFFNQASVTLTTLNPDGKAIDHVFEIRRKAIEFIDEFFRTASEDEEIYIAP